MKNSVHNHSLTGTVDQILKDMYVKNEGADLNKFQVKEIIALAKLEGTMMTEEEENQFLTEYSESQR